MLHHVVYEQHVRHRDGDVFDPDNSLTLCQDCHLGHHGGKKISTQYFRPENLRFAERLLGAYTQDYFKRFYNDGNLLLSFIGESA